MNLKYPQYDVFVETAGTHDASVSMAQDVDAVGDILLTTQEEIQKLAKNGFIENLNKTDVSWVKNNNCKQSVNAVTYNKLIYGFPVSISSGYFLLYDKSVIKNPNSLEKIISDCKKKNKKFVMDLNNAWYNAAFFNSVGVGPTYNVDSKWVPTSVESNYGTSKGVIALREIIELINSTVYDGDTVSSKYLQQTAAMVSGSWDKKELKELWGNNYACAKLPEYRGVNGKKYQLSSYGGYNIFVINRYSKCPKKIKMELVKFLSNESSQLEFYKECGYTPSNLNTQKNKMIKKDKEVCALIEQSKYAVPQLTMGTSYWSVMGTIIDDVLEKKFNKKSSNAQLLKYLMNKDKLLKKQFEQITLCLATINLDKSLRRIAGMHRRKCQQS